MAHIYFHPLPSAARASGREWGKIIVWWGCAESEGVPLKNGSGNSDWLLQVWVLPAPEGILPPPPLLRSSGGPLSHTFLRNVGGMAGMPPPGGSPDWGIPCVAQRFTP